jgi:hypothetical protein
MVDLLTTCAILLAIGGPAYAVLRLYWRMRAAERDLRNERLKSSRLEREVRQLEQALFEAQRAVALAADSSQHPPAAGAAAAERPQERS